MSGTIRITDVLTYLILTATRYNYNSSLREKATIHQEGYNAPSLYHL